MLRENALRELENANSANQASHSPKSRNSRANKNYRVQCQPQKDSVKQKKHKQAIAQ
jgi:hypothetical protein